jgi:conjugal transfer/entry exclusion protein
MSRAKTKPTPRKRVAEAPAPFTTLRPRYEVELDATKASDILDAMEDTLHDADNLINAIRLIADGITNRSDQGQSALYGVASALEEANARAEMQRQEAKKLLPSWSVAS